MMAQRNPRLYTTGIHKRVVKEVRAGASITAAFQTAGIPHRTAWRWMAHGREDHDAGVKSVLAKLAVDVEKAEGHALQKAREALTGDSAPTPWQWYLHLQQRHESRDKSAQARDEAVADADTEEADPQLAFIQQYNPPPVGGESEEDYRQRCDEQRAKMLVAHWQRQRASPRDESDDDADEI